MFQTKYFGEKEGVGGWRRKNGVQKNKPDKKVYSILGLSLFH